MRCVMCRSLCLSDSLSSIPGALFHWFWMIILLKRHRLAGCLRSFGSLCESKSSPLICSVAFSFDLCPLKCPVNVPVLTQICTHIYHLGCFDVAKCEVQNIFVYCLFLYTTYAEYMCKGSGNYNSSVTVAVSLLSSVNGKKCYSCTLQSKAPPTHTHRRLYSELSTAA